MTDFDGKMKQMQTQLKALEVTHDVHAKSRLLEATYELRDCLNRDILAITDEYTQTRLQRQMELVEKSLKKHTVKLEQASQQSIEMEVQVPPVSVRVPVVQNRLSIGGRRSVTAEEVLELIVQKDLSSR